MNGFIINFPHAQNSTVSFTGFLSAKRPVYEQIALYNVWNWFNRR